MKHTLPVPVPVSVPVPDVSYLSRRSGLWSRLS
jgi:hypothetical protein